MAAHGHETGDKEDASGGGAVPALARELLAGGLASLVSIAYCLSFAALIFAREIAEGLPFAFWGFLLSSAVATLLAGALSTLPPVLAAPRNPVVAVMAVLAATVSAAAFARGLDGAAAARHVLVAVSLASLVGGLLFWLLGTLRLAQLVRFIPHPVIAGFLAASGLLLMLGGLRVASGLPMPPPGLAAFGDPGVVLRLVVATAFAASLLASRQTARGSAALPVLIIAAAVLLDIVLWLAGVRAGWYLDAAGGARGWSPLGDGPALDLVVLRSGAVEMVSIAAVAAISLLLDVTSLEVQRGIQADMDVEFRNLGATNLAVLPAGGLLVAHALAPTRLMDTLGGHTWRASFAGGVVLAAVLGLHFDVPALVPRPVLGGILIFLGIGILGDALKAPGRRGWLELGLAALIMGAIVWLGYLTGIVLGVIGASVLFALSYSRIGVVRRRVTRAELAAPVERAPEALRLLAAEGGRIHVLWLTGYIFFGSSNRLYDEICGLPRGADAGRTRWVVLDCTGVTGLDAAALLSLHKLVNWAARSGVTLAVAGAAPGLSGELAGAGLLLPQGGAAGGGMRAFASRNDALEWCEDALLDAAGLARTGDDEAAFAAWLEAELGRTAAQRLVAGYLERRELAAGEVVCTLGAPSDTIELVATGSVAVMLPGLSGGMVRVRRMTGRTVVGEMGFFRRLPRAASVMAEGRSTIYVMTRAAYARLVVEDAALATDVLEFVVRVLSDRVEVANREITALL